LCNLRKTVTAWLRKNPPELIWKLRIEELLTINCARFSLNLPERASTLTQQMLNLKKGIKGTRLFDNEEDIILQFQPEVTAMEV